MHNELKNRMEEEILELCDERENIKDLEGKIKYDKNITEMFKAYNDRLKLDYDDCSEGRRLEHEKDKYLAEIQQKNNEIEKKTKVDMVKNVIYGLGTAAGIGLAMLGRKDEREGFLTEDKIKLFDKFFKNK